METSNSLATLANKIKQLGSMIETEEATKNAFVMPFLNTDGKGTQAILE